MNEEVKKKWLEALRSGEYTQTTRRLHDDKGFCCLGVLCDLYGKENAAFEWEPTGSKDGERTAWCSTYDFSGSTLPEPVQIWAGLENHNPYWYEEGQEDEAEAISVANLNDTGKTFAEIADLIEKML